MEEFFPSISKCLVEKALWHPFKYKASTNATKNIIIHARKSVLFSNNQALQKKSGDTEFDVTMGSYDEAELSELEGLLILNSLNDMHGPNTSGLYRDDGLCCFTNVSGSESDRIRKDLIHPFKEKFDLKTTIKANLRIFYFLDDTFNLTTEVYKTQFQV